MTEIIDNKKVYLADKLNGEMKGMNELAIASAYFNVAGFSILRGSLLGKRLKFLLGREPESNVAYQDEILQRLESEALEREDDSSFFDEVNKAVEFFSGENVNVHMIKDRFFHGKAYMGASPSFSEIRSGKGNGFACTGSSNFTAGGLRGNRELNMLTTERDAVAKLSEWFDDVWSDSVDFKPNLISFLDNYVTSHSPLEIVGKALYEYFRGRVEAASSLPDSIDLFPHQKLSATGAWSILQKYGGAIVADPVGLGKTRVAIYLATLAMTEGLKPLLIAPKSILETTWKSEMDKVMGLHIPYVNTEAVSRDPSILNRYKDKNFIIIDEAHYFRSSSSRRFDALSEYLSNEDRKILFLTATPINNSLMDLYNLLALFVKDDEIQDISPSMKGYFAEQQKKLIHESQINLDPVINRFVVRTSRGTAERLANGAIAFPTRRVEAVEYLVSPNPEVVNDILESLDMMYYDLAIDKQVDYLLLPDGTEISVEKQLKKKENLKEMVKTIIQLGLMKRFESSIYSLEESLSNVKEYLEMTLKIAEVESVFVPPKLKKEVYQNEEGFVFNVPDKEREKLSFQNEEKDRYMKSAHHDIEKLDNLLHLIGSYANDDPKVNKLLEDILKIKLEGNNGVIIFTSYFDTAEYLYNKMSLIPSIKSRLMMITGSVSRGPNSDDRFRILDDFIKNGGYLISTDVLSAGQNLQNAQYVVNYDFPWNPVVLIQRTGRIDRLKSPHNLVYVKNVIPEKKDKDDKGSLEHFLGLMRKLSSKLEGIRKSVGSDVSILGEEPIPKDVNNIVNILRGNEGELRKLEEEYMKKLGGLVSAETPLDIYERLLEELGEEKIKRIPYGSGAFKESERRGTFILYKYRRGDVDEFRWILKLDGGEVITDVSKIIEFLLSEPANNKGEKIDYSILKEKFRTMKEEFLKIERMTSTKNVRSLPRDLRDVVEHVSSDTALLPYLPSLMQKQSDLNLLKVLKKALREGRLNMKLKEIFGDNPSVIPNNDMEESARDIHRVVWCSIGRESTREDALSIQKVFPSS